MSRAGLVTLVVANLFVVFQTLRHEWGYYETLLIYWTEVVILGVYNVFRLMVVGVVMVLLKLAADAASHRLEHGWLARDPPHAYARPKELSG